MEKILTNGDDNEECNNSYFSSSIVTVVKLEVIWLQGHIRMM
jgi:hypothetical protein